jgi:hypothetical protein
MIAFGGVATGNIKANEQAIVAGTIKNNQKNCKEWAG